MPGIRRPHRSNSPTALDRSLRAAKTIYWNAAALQKLLYIIIKPNREEWFAARVRALKSWPQRTKAQISDDASRIRPRRLMSGGWSWPMSVLAHERKQVPPDDTIDSEALGRALADLDNRQGDRLIAELAKRMPEPKGTPTGLDTAVLMKVRKAHKKMMRSLATDPDREIDLTEGAKVHDPHISSSAGWWLKPGGWWWMSNKNKLPR